MKSIYQVQVGKNGMITLPKDIRENSHIETEDILTITDVGDGVFVIHPHRSKVDALADKLTEEWRASGETLESMLDTLRNVRAAHDTEDQ